MQIEFYIDWFKKNYNIVRFFLFFFCLKLRNKSGFKRTIIYVFGIFFNYTVYTLNVVFYVKEIRCAIFIFLCCYGQFFLVNIGLNSLSNHAFALKAVNDISDNTINVDDLLDNDSDEPASENTDDHGSYSLDQSFGCESGCFVRITSDKKISDPDLFF